ncbi:MAG: potassium/proton antiporter [Solirubrobacteraceae bacterium]
MTEGEAILAAGGLLAAALAASLLAGRIRVPGLVLFLGVGMALGSDGLGWIAFDDYETARVVGVVALGLILFEGGLAAGYDEIGPVLVPAAALAVVGTVVTAVVAGFVAAWLFDLTTLEGMLLGSILASTDGAAIFSVLRGSTLRRRLARTLEGEAGFNDPVAVLLVLGFIAWIQQPGYGVADMLVLFAEAIGIGAAVGLAVGWAGVEALKRTRLASAGLYPVASLGIAAVAFGAADVLHGSGFLAVYLAGLALGSAPIPAKRTIVTFHSGMGWLAQVVMFLTLGLLVFPSQLGGVALQGTVLAVVIVGVARPLGVFASTLGLGFGVAERVVLGWAGLRGAVPVVLATFPVIAGISDSLEFFNIVFFAVVVSTVVQGTTFEGLAKRLGVTTAEAALPQPLVDVSAVRRLGAEVVEFPVEAGHAIAGHRVREAGLPRDALLNVIIRGEEAILPRGSTRVEVGDRLHLLVRQEASVELRGLLRRWQTGPVGAPPRARPPLRASPRPFSLRPWDAADGDSGAPVAIGGVEVHDQLLTRRDGAPGALVVLVDGRYAFTGPVLGIGNRTALLDGARRQLRLADDDSERAWWRNVIGALAAPEV